MMDAVKVSDMLHRQSRRLSGVESIDGPQLKERISEYMPKLRAYGIAKECLIRGD